MARKLLLFSGMLVLSAAATLGCTHHTAQPAPPDPLIVSHHASNKTVVDAKPSGGSGKDSTAQTYPTPPAIPDANVTAKKGD